LDEKTTERRKITVTSYLIIPLLFTFLYTGSLHYYRQGIYNPSLFISSSSVVFLHYHTHKTKPSHSQSLHGHTYYWL